MSEWDEFEDRDPTIRPFLERPLTSLEKRYRDSFIALSGTAQALAQAQLRLARGEVSEARFALVGLDTRLEGCIKDVDRLLELRGERNPLDFRPDPLDGFHSPPEGLSAPTPSQEAANALQGVRRPAPFVKPLAFAVVIGVAFALGHLLPA